MSDSVILCSVLAAHRAEIMNLRDTKGKSVKVSKDRLKAWCDIMGIALVRMQQQDAHQRSAFPGYADWKEEGVPICLEGNFHGS